MSDWGGTNTAAEGLKAGLDLEMPKPPRIRTAANVIAALNRGELAMEDLDERVRTFLYFLQKVGAFSRTSVPSPTTVDRAAHRALIRDARARGIVLLKNEDSLLPLTAEKVKGKTIALIGLAKDALAHGGGSVAVNAHYKITPWQGLQTSLGNGVKLLYAKGTPCERLLTPLSKEGQNGVVVGLDRQPDFSRIIYDRDGVTTVSTLHEFSKSLFG